MKANDAIHYINTFRDINEPDVWKNALYENWLIFSNKTYYSNWNFFSTKLKLKIIY